MLSNNLNDIFEKNINKTDSDSDDIEVTSSFSDTSITSISNTIQPLLNDKKSSTINEFITNDFTKLCGEITYVPAILPAVRRIVVLGDIHGDYNLAIEYLKLAKVISPDFSSNTTFPSWIGKDTYIIQVGDQIDRCRPNSVGNLRCTDPQATIDDENSDVRILEIFTDLDKQARKVGGAVISLLGNHELMNVAGQFDYVSKKGITEFDNYTDKESGKTFSSGEDARKFLFAPGNSLGKLLGCSRIATVIIGSNLFVHAGMLDIILEKLNVTKPSDLESINVLVRKWLLGLINIKYVNHIINASPKSMFWTRILGSIPPNMSNEHSGCIKHIEKVLSMFKIGTIIVGHTPQSFLYSHGINSTCDGKVFRVDNGSSAAFHGFDEIYMQNKKLGKNIKSPNREAQVLEILNDTEFNILK